MATVAHYIRSHYDPKDRETLEIATGQTPTNTDSDQPLQDSRTTAGEPEDPWQTESAFGAERRLAASAPRFVAAAMSYDEVNNMLGGFRPAVLQPPAEEPKDDVGGWYRSLTRITQAKGLRTVSEAIQKRTMELKSEASTSSQAVAYKPPVARPRPDKNSWFISRALQSEPSSAPATLPTPSTLADILEREPPKAKQPVVPPVFLALGPSNKGWGMLQQNGWSEGEGLGANAPRRAPRPAVKAEPPVASSSKVKLESVKSKVKIERQEVQLDSDGDISEVRKVEVVDLTLSDSDEESDEVEGSEDGSVTMSSGSSSPASLSRETSPHSKPLLTPIPTILKSDRLGIGLKAKKVGPYKASKKRVTHNQAALAAHVRATEEMRRMKALVGRGSRGFARMAKAEAEQRRQLLASLNES